jgi:hypothetical protein
MKNGEKSKSNIPIGTPSPIQEINAPLPEVQEIALAK